MPDPVRHWFPAKRYGWGWGPPTVWQGWLTLAVFFALIGAGALIFLPRQAIVAYIVYLVVVTLLLIVLCSVKGEKPRWRWGED